MKTLQYIIITLLLSVFGWQNTWAQLQIQSVKNASPNACDGEITVRASAGLFSEGNGAAPFTVEIRDANTAVLLQEIPNVNGEVTFTNLCPKNYVIQAINSLSCTHLIGEQEITTDGNSNINAGFNYRPLQNINIGNEIEFTSEISGGVGTLRYEWDFGDSNKQYIANPKHTFTSSGSFNVTLSVRDDSSPNPVKVTKQIIVSDNSGPGDQANFTASTTTGPAPLTVSFTGPTSPNIKEYRWTFYKGSDGFEYRDQQNPTITYGDYGDFDVTLEVEYYNGQTFENRKENYINVGYPLPGFAIEIESICNHNDYINNIRPCNNRYLLGENTYFTGDDAFGSFGIPRSWNWDFGDGTTTTDQGNVSYVDHRYNTPGYKTITVTCTNTQGQTATTSKTIFITDPNPSIEANFQKFNYDLRHHTGPVTFTNNSVANNIAPSLLSYQWDFGVGANPRTATGKGPHQVCYDPDEDYIGAGYRRVRLTVSARVNNRTIQDEYDEEFGVYVDENGNLFDCGIPTCDELANIESFGIFKSGTNEEAACIKDRPQLNWIGDNLWQDRCYVGWTIVDQDNGVIVSKRTGIGGSNPTDGEECFWADNPITGEKDVYFCMRDSERFPNSGFSFPRPLKPTQKHLSTYIEHKAKTTGYPVTLDLQITVFKLSDPRESRIFTINSTIDNPNIEIDNTLTACLAQPLELWQDKEVDPNEEYEWTATDPNHLNYLSATDVPNPTFTKSSGLGEHRYTLTVRNILTGCSDSKTITVNVGGGFIEDKKFTTQTEEPILLYNPKFTEGDDPRIYSWSPSNNISNPTHPYPLFNASAAGVYEYVLTITDALGCTIVTNVSVDVIAPDDCNAIYDGNLIVTNLDEAREANQYCIINGDLIIEDDPNTSDSQDENGNWTFMDIKHLRSLDNIKKIQGDLVIKNTTLDMGQAMESLEYVGGNFSITNCNASGTGLPKLSVIEKQLLIENNARVRMGNLFSKLVSVGEIIVNNNAIIELSDVRFRSLTSAPGGITITNNPDLFRLSGTDNVEKLGPLVISNNAELDHVIGFLNVTALEGDLKISDNPKLRWVGLTSLNDINGDMLITNNQIMENIIGSNKLSSIQGRLDLYENPVLENACSLSYVLETPGRIGSYQTEIRNNGATTSSKDAIINNCNNDCIYNGDLVINSQQQIDNFKYCKVNGNVTIIKEPYDPALGWRSINNLLGLRSLTEVSGDFKILDTGLSSLQGLANLVKVGANLEIVNNQYLNNACDIIYLLENEDAVGGEKIISKNKFKANSVNNIRYYCAQPECENSYNGDLVLDSQAKVDDFKYCEINGDLIIDQHEGTITNLDALSTLTRINNGSLVIRTNFQLTNVNGLRNLEYVSVLKIEHNDALTSLEGLSNLHYVGRLLILDNPSLLNIGLHGLSNMESISSLAVYDNTSLESACSIVNLIEDPKHAGYIYDNGPDTSSAQAIIDNCASSGCVYEGNLRLTSQIELDGFRYCEINGDLIIEEANDSYLFDISALATLTRINGDLFIVDNDNLANFKGLENLGHIGGQISINGNDAITNLNALSGITIVNRNLSIINNSNLSDITGLSRITHIDHTFSIGGNKLTNLNGLSSLTTIGGRFLLYQSNLSSLDGLTNLTSVGDAIQFLENPLLNNVDGLSGITSISGYIGNLDIVNNPGLEQLDGLRNIISVGGNLNISDNTRLQNACGVVNLLEDLSSVSGTITIANNDTNTSFIQDILDNCSNPCANQGDLILSSQAEIDAFENCEITGNLIIKESQSGNIVNLEKLNTLSKIGGDLIIQDNAALTNTFGLRGLTEVGGSITVVNNGSLKEILDFFNITILGGDFLISGNNSLESIRGINFSNIPANPQMSISILSNPSLSDLEGLNGISIAKQIAIALNNSLTNIDHLSDLNTVESIIIANNNNLIEVDGLSNLTQVTTELTLQNNTDLAYACGIAQLLEDPNAVSGTITISNNDTSTSSPQDIIDYCNNPCVYQGDLNLKTQADVDAFTYCEVTGNLAIGGPDINDLSNLSTLTKVIGDVSIVGNSSLTNLSGLNNLTQIKGGLLMMFNNIQEINGLSNLTFIGESLGIIGNRALTNVNGLQQLSSVKTISLSGNNELQNINGLSISGSIENLFITNNGKLSHLNGLSTISLVNGNLTLQNNTALDKACGIMQLLEIPDAVSGTIIISDNGPTTSTVQDIISECTITCSGSYQGDVILTSQTEVDAFNYCELRGNLTIQEAVAGDITNLDALRGLNTLTGYLRVRHNTALVNLDGLIGLTVLDNSLEIWNNGSLSNIDGLRNITSVSRRINIISNSALQNLNGLANVSGGIVNLEIVSNFSLQNIDGLSKITSVAIDIKISNNPLLSNINGLSGLSALSGSITIAGNSIITDINSLSGLTTVGNHIKMTYNRELLNLDGLSNVISTGGSTLVADNGKLENACGLMNLINGNYPVTLENNAASTSSKSDVVAYCTSQTATTARFLDPSSNGNKKAAGKLHLYPNPVKNELHIATNENIVSVSIMNHLGRTLYKNDAVNSNKYLIDHIDYPSGIYFVHITTNTKMVIKKIVVK